MCVRPPALPLAGDDPLARLFGACTLTCNCDKSHAIAWASRRLALQVGTLHSTQKIAKGTPLPEPEGVPAGVQRAEALPMPPRQGAHFTHLSRVRPVFPACAPTPCEAGGGFRARALPPVQPTAAPAAHGGALARGLPTGQGATAGGRRPIARGIISTSRTAVHELHWPFCLPSPPRPPSIRPATTACPPSPTCTCWCCTTTRCVPLVFSFWSVRHPD